jgi:PilZ domain
VYNHSANQNQRGQLASDKRKFKRRHLILYLQVIDTDSENILGYLVDITPQGMMLMSEFPIKAGLTFQLKMLVNTDLSQHSYLSFAAKSVWCHKSINSDFYDTGLQLLNVEPNAFHGIETVIEELGFTD